MKRKKHQGKAALTGRKATVNFFCYPFMEKEF
jgi:hypothetical protein